MGLNSGDPEWFPTDVFFSPYVFLPPSFCFSPFNQQINSENIPVFCTCYMTRKSMIN